jgi:hypothetical protein
MASQPSVSVINKLTLSRHIFRLADDSLRSQREVAVFTAVMLMQDAVEVFLLAAAEHVGATINQNPSFDSYFTKINERIQPKTLAFQVRLTALNKARVNAKHYGLKPDRKEIEGFAVACREFFEETCAFLFDRPFWSISLLDLLPSGEPKQLLANATELFDAGDYLACLIECRKVVFVLFEWNYDVAKFREGDPGPFNFSDAPFYAQNKAYIEKNVKDPFEYIVLDHEKLTRTLLSDGIDPQVFWNVWRLTPPVYRRGNSEKWLVKRVLERERNADENAAAYVLEHSIDIALLIDERRRLVRMAGNADYLIHIKRDGVNVYQKADRKSAVLSVTKPGLREITVTEAADGLNGDGVYWQVMHMVKDLPKETPLLERFYFGYIHEDDVDWSNTQNLPSGKEPMNEPVTEG